ncbi:NAD(P)/FAD-dependent oxidoreductase [Mycobacterium sp. AZCC_0083]|uniref:NAD(P)/FAD-dependent oxidoreductase n=1 Tax=Mycobacterium sp. AZCC_0083 TaxID=2735882 RepID=UPI00160CA02B|nr:FAD/NAD(P)-binding oxidoreductase [Mycobacterium sp. AZCC_0083]MBB5160538.1 3-phenylpropionate/trans-cinnamate dioxygenase ferredoxin reductase subunit [Mycobacterium sp. AZCC_0083]
MTPPGVVVVGASAAGLSVAETLRRDGFTEQIALIGDENQLPYDRPPLSKEVLAGTWSEDQVRLRDPDRLGALELDLRLGVRAEAVDIATRTVALSDGSEVDYRDLVIATGVRPRRLPGTDGVAGVHVLRTLDDARRLRSELAGGPRLVIVGAGFLGAEVASVARAAGATVTLVSDVDAPLSDVLGHELGQLLIGVHADHGVRVHAGVKVIGIATEDGRATGVQLADGTTLDADVVLVSIGSIPNIEWLAASGIPTGNGVVCDEYCRAAPGVWAAGDVASWNHVGIGERIRVEHRTNAAEQGMAVARNILAGSNPAPFVPVPYIWSDQYDLKIQIYGLPRGAESFTVTDGSLADRKLVAIYGKGGRTRAAVGINMMRPLRTARSLVAEQAELTSILNEGVTA